MNSIENFQRILHFDHPERVISKHPIQLIRYTGTMHEDFDNSGGDESPVNSEWKDIWGTVWRKVHADVMGLPMVCPLAEISNLKKFTWPDPDDERICQKIYQMAEEFDPNAQGGLLLGGNHRDTLWEKAYMLVGMENMMVYFLTEPEFSREVLHRIMDFQLGIAHHYIKAGVQVAFLGDDLGGQTGPLLSRRLVNELLVPEYRRLCQFYQDHGVMLRFHSCGNVEAFLDMFIELGVTILNPVQATANNLEKVRALTMGKMTLHGGVSSKLLMEGPVERIQQETRSQMWKLGREGGYICGPDQSLPFPVAHLQALEETVERYGMYPIQPPNETGVD